MMVTIKGIVNTIKTTSNFWDAILVKYSKQKKHIIFRNGVKIEVNGSEYALLRDWFIDLQEKSFSIKPVIDGYLIKNFHSNSEFKFKTQNLLSDKTLLDFLLDLVLDQWVIENIENQYKVQKGKSTCFIEQLSANIFLIKTQKIQIVGPREILYVHFKESEAGLYDYNYHGKVVLDIGGFCGETAAFFSGEGAKKVIVYEPVQMHHDFIERNIERNNANIELHKAGIGKTDGSLIVNFDSLDLSFGLCNTGLNQTVVDIKNVKDVIVDSNADVAKIDCEGAETSLLDLPPEILGLIDFYFIETHSEEIEKAIVTKFYDSGFVKARESIKLSTGIAMHYFKKNTD